MGRVNTYLHAFNAGVHDADALPRVDLARMRLAAEKQTNLLPMATGPMFMRPGLEYLGSTDENARTRLKEFVFGATDAALMEFGDGTLRIRNEDVLVIRPHVTAQIQNGDFDSADGWDLSATDGASATIAGGTLNLSATSRGSQASASQQVTVNQQNVEHALRIVVNRGPVIFRCGSTSGADDYIFESQLRAGTHSLAFTPTTNSFYITFLSEERSVKIIDSINVEAEGVMELPAPWGVNDHQNMRFAQSADVVFVACRGIPQRRIERRSLASWSVVLYQADDGPFVVPQRQHVRLKPDVTSGNGTLSSDAPFFTPNHVGVLFRLFHSGQNIVASLSAEDTYTDSIRVVGIAENEFDLTVSGTWAGTLTLQRSYDNGEIGFVDTHESDFGEGHGPVSITENGTWPYDPKTEWDNVVHWYRVGFKSGDYTSGTATVAFGYGGGGGFGICRVTGYTSPTQVQIEVLTPFKGTAYTSDWRQGEWSENQFWPSAVAFSDGRLWWSGRDRIWGSVSDAFESFDEEHEGDAGPISRSIATGGINETQWLMSLQRLVIGTEGTISIAKSSSLDEPLTPTGFAIRDTSTIGVAPIDPAKLDGRGLVIERAGLAVLELVFNAASAEYSALQLSKLTTDLFSSGVKELAVQRRPDTRIWIITNDGGCVCCLYEPDQEVMAFVPIETDGAFESVAVLPSTRQDRVYFVVRRIINGSTVRYIEKMALDEESKPSTHCKVMDSFRGGAELPPTTTINVGAHLRGKTVVVWADGAPVEVSPGQRGEFTVDANGNITLNKPVTHWISGLPYTARYKSARLAYGAEGGTAMLQRKVVEEVGLIMTDFTRQGINAGDKFDNLYELPELMDAMEMPDVVLSSVHDEVPFPVGGDWGLDKRLCMELQSPYTAKFLGLTLAVTTNG